MSFLAHQFLLWLINLLLSNIFKTFIEHREVVRNIGFNIVWKWQSAFLWESPLANGTVPSFNNIDAQISFKLPKIKSTLKVGGSNVLNNRYIQYAAGPTIGGLYYVALTVDGLLKQ